MVPCPNKFGNNARIFGGTHGMAEAPGAATENQGNDTPHVHGVMAIVTPYQNKTLAEIRESIEKDLNQFERIKRFITHMCRDDHFDDAGHQESLGALERAKAANLAGSTHMRLAQMLAIYRRQVATEPKGSLWEPGITEKQRAAIAVDAANFKGAHEAHVQHVLSHVQHHWHREEDGHRVPHPYCRKKGRNMKKKKGKREKGYNDEVCKQDYPATNRLNLVPRVIRPGVATQQTLAVKGRRNALRLLLGIRRCKWFSGTSPMYADAMRSNSHTAPNFRIPLTEATHESSCKSRCTAVSDKRLCQIAQRAMRQMTGYFSGYICKRQPIQI